MKLIKGIIDEIRGGGAVAPEDRMPTPEVLEVKCKTEPIRGLLNHLASGAARSTEHHAYADFTLEGKSCGIEVYYSVVPPRRIDIGIDLGVSEDRSRRVKNMIDDIAASAEVHQLGSTMLSVYTRDPETAANILSRLLLDVCSCGPGSEAAVQTWWS